MHKCIKFITSFFFFLIFQSTNIKRPAGYVETDIRQENVPLHSYEAMTKDREMKQYEQPTDVSSSENENYVEPNQTAVNPATEQTQEIKQTTVSNTSHSNVKVSGVTSDTSHVTNFKLHETVALDAMESSVKETDDSYLDMGKEQKLNYLEIIATDEEMEECDLDTVFYRETESENDHP
jgi:hypothetical protein